MFFQLRNKIAVLLAIVIGIVCCRATFERVYDIIKGPSQPAYVAGFRDIARYVPKTDVALLVNKSGVLSPADRTCLLALNWGIAPRVACALDARDAVVFPGCLVSSAYLPVGMKRRFREKGLEIVSSNDEACLWTWGEKSCAKNESGACSSVRGVIGTIVFMAIGLLIWKWMAGPFKIHRWDAVIAIVIFVVLAVCALRHGLSAPNGLGVYAGKARLFMLSQGIPSGFWSDARYAVFQPGYPPMMTLLAWGYFSVAGFFEPGLQCVVPFVVTLLYLSVVRGIEGLGRRLFCVLFFLSPLTITLGCGCYGEPLAALFLVVAFRNYIEEKFMKFSLLLILLTLTRPEGFMLAVLLLIVVAMDRAKVCSATTRISFLICVILVLMVGVGWWSFVYCAGTGIQDYTIFKIPSLLNFQIIGRKLFNIWECLDRNGAVGIWFLIVFMCALLGKGISRQISLFVLVAIGFGCLALAFFETKDFGWLVSRTLPRYIWLVTMLPLAEMHFKSAAENRTRCNNYSWFEGCFLIKY